MDFNKNYLKLNNKGNKFPSGYRMVYFYENTYLICEYCKTIEGFMLGFADTYPIMTDDDVPEFISIDDLLDRCLKMDAKAKSVELYKTNGTLIAKKVRTMQSKI